MPPILSNDVWNAWILTGSNQTIKQWSGDTTEDKCLLVRWKAGFFPIYHDMPRYATSEWTTLVLSSYPKLKYHLRLSIIRNIYQWWHIALASSPISILSICKWQHGYKIIQTIIKPYQWAGCSLVWHCKLSDLTACRLQSQSSPFACLEALPTLSAHPCTRHMSWNGRWMSENLNGGRLIHGSSPQHRMNEITRCIWSFSPLL